MNFLSTGQVTKMVRSATRNVSHQQLTTESTEGAHSSLEEIKVDVVTDTSSISVPPNKSAFVDKITMEYMMNRNHYKKYLAKTNTVLYQEVQDKMKEVQLHSEDILEMVNDLLIDYISHGSFTKHNTDVNQSFEEFMTICMRYIEENPKDEPDQEDSDILFGEPKNMRKKR